MTHSLLTVRCTDLHRNCPAVLRASSPEEVVLAYVLHHAEAHADGEVELDDLLSSVRVSVVPRSPEHGRAVPDAVGAAPRRDLAAAV